ncbi:MAG: cation diffusion facilitator family transporter [Alphaproteobacteria bacterium]|nr:cation diffusion facilitator family transporter [Alphaproteobacteria bacterium]
MPHDSLTTAALTAPPSRLMRFATYAAVGTAVMLIIVKTVAFLITNSVALLSSLIDSVLDLFASLVTLWAVGHALTPADKEHRFGHGKAEPLSGLAQSAFVAGSAVLLLVEAASRINKENQVLEGDFGIGVMIFTIVVTLLLVGFQKFVVKRTGSVAISADSLHYTGDLLLNLSVIGALVLATYGDVGWADPVFAIGIAFFLLWNASRIARKSIAVLMDHELPEEQRQAIKATVLKHPKVLDVHELRTRSSGLQIFMQMHMVLDPKLSLLEAHRIADEVEMALMADYPGADIIIHQDPEGVDEYHQPVGSALA